MPCQIFFKADPIAEEKYNENSLQRQYYENTPIQIYWKF